MLYPIGKELNMTLFNNSIFKNSYLVVCALSTLLLSACGGDSGGGSGAAATPALATATKMEDLVVPDGFDYNPMGDYELDIDISSITTARSFVSVYTRFSIKNDSSYKPDYSSKVIAGSLNSGTFDSSFSAPSVEDEFLVEVWFFDDQPPLQQVFSTSESQLTW